MCGIGGLLLNPADLVKPEWLHAFLDHLEHRGPDDRGWLTLNRGTVCQGQKVQSDLVAEIALVHRRLSILDLSNAGHQPMGSPDGRYWIVFNGEIYNYLELREELERLGHRFHSRSDTEVLLIAFAQWGVQVLRKLIGMFAFAIVDRHERRLWLVRDFFGIKPLYYTYWQEGLAFASEIAPLLNLPGVTREVNPQRLYDYLRCGILDHGPDTMFAQIRHLPAAHYLEVPLDSPRPVQPQRYWAVDLTQRSGLSFDEAATRLRDLFFESVRLHLRSDVPVGAALSGGIDSSSIVMAMRRIDPHLDIHAVSYLADDPVLTEERWVNLVGASAGAKVHRVCLTPEEMAADLDHLIFVQGEPFGSTSIYAQYRVFQRAREAGIKVMLDGQGADELLGGYPDYRLARLTSLLRQGKWGEAWHLSHSSSTPAAARYLLLRATARSAPAFVQACLRRGMRSATPPKWLNAEWFEEREVERQFVDHMNGTHALKNELHRTLTQTSLPQLLHYEDRNSMAFSIESRVPFLSPALVEFLFTLPEAYLISSNGISKAVFRQAMRGIVPDAVLDRRDKLGFPTPESQWLLSLRTWVERVLTSEEVHGISAFNIAELHRNWADIVQGARPYDSSVWRWVNTILWAQQFRVGQA